MAARYLRTSDIAKAVGVHPNTVRLYEAWGFLASIPRSASGYRLFTQSHLEQMRLAYLALKWPYPGGKEVVVNLVQRAAQGDLGMAMELAYQYLANVRMERTYAEAAVEFLERWARGQQLDTTRRDLQIGEAAARLGVTVDVLRNWERNGLLSVPRDPATGYRCYGAAEIGRLRVIRMLRQAGYSLMAILRMLLQLDAGITDDLRTALDTPRPDEDAQTVADHWLSTLADQESRAQMIIQQIAHMIDLAQYPAPNPKRRQ
ncbi:MAG: MerR family transcriptional regulator [Caldilineaceae bacterium]|nr:MerR family transcriptional regulator [Caldilineaceae bacterium]